MGLELLRFISSPPVILLSCLFWRNALAEINDFNVSTSTHVEYLPGLEGPLPFYLETGYVGVGASNQDQLFYYFVASQSKPEVDPLILWLTGGPACSVLCAFAGIGPLLFKDTQYHDNNILPDLVLNSYSWTKAASMLFVDQPVVAGFSYTEGRRNKPIGDVDAMEQAYEFLKKWLVGHPQFISNPLYIGGDSYAGKLVPFLAFSVVTGIKEKDEPKINFQGYLLGNPIMDAETDFDSRVPFAHGMGLISHELYMSAEENCKGAYTKAPNKHCKNDLDAIEKLLSGIEPGHILDKKCSVSLSKSYSPLRDRSLEEVNLQLHHLTQPIPNYGCKITHYYLLMTYWANNDAVRNALGIRKGSISDWTRCSSHKYSQDVGSAIRYHRYLSAQAYRALVFSGDHDSIVPYIGTQTWIKSLNYSIVNDWRPWLLDNQVAGYTRTYSNNMTFATVKGGGHIAADFKPAECFAMFRRWISLSPL